ncbi:MAG: phosphatase PAP2 family protein [Spirochaetes bacterium]|nr:phosphatase PAP2 family protein [Spirochaetota bacterium]
MFTEGLIMVLGVTELSKGIVGRERPLMYNDDIPNSDKLERGEDGSMSFFSGHTSFSFYSAAFVSTVFSDLYPDSGYRYLVTGTTFAAASLVGYMRYEAGSHFPSDIIVGAAVGSAIGYLIPGLHRKKGSGIAVSHVFIGSSNGLMLSACF